MSVIKLTHDGHPPAAQDAARAPEGLGKRLEDGPAGLTDRQPSLEIVGEILGEDGDDALSSRRVEDAGVIGDAAERAGLMRHFHSRGEEKRQPVAHLLAAHHRQDLTADVDR